MTLLQTATSICPGNSISFKGSGGVEPYTYSVVSGGGSINASTGLYTAPNTPSLVVVKVVDSAGTPAQATANLKVNGPLKLFCDVIQNFLELEDDQIYIYNQKVKIPPDDKLYVAVKVLNDKPFSNINRTSSAGDTVSQISNFSTILMVDILSRTTEALERRHEVILALQSVYSKQQQMLNAFSIARTPSQMLPLNSLDGSAIPYRFTINVGIQYAVRKDSEAPYFDEFQSVGVQVDP